MCNHLHDDSKPIKQSGIGWKVFTKIGNEYYTMAQPLVKFNNEEKNIWNEKGSNIGDGFCFLLSKHSAEKLRKVWMDPKCVIKRIRFSKGLGRHIENGIASHCPISMALCKEFEIILGKGESRRCQNTSYKVKVKLK